MYYVKPYKYRFFAVYLGHELICVTVYRKGAQEVARRLNALSTPNMEGTRDVGRQVSSANLE